MRLVSTLWKAYLVAWIGSRTISLGGGFATAPSPITGAYLVLGLVGCVPLVGFILQRPFLRPNVWRVWLLCALSWALLDLVHFSDWFAQHVLWIQILGISLAVPSYLAVYAYSRPNDPLWSEKAAA